MALRSADSHFVSPSETGETQEKGKRMDTWSTIESVYLATAVYPNKFISNYQDTAYL